MTKILEILHKSSRKYDTETITKPLVQLLKQTKNHLREAVQLDDQASHKRFFSLGTINLFLYFHIETDDSIAKFYLGHINAIAKCYPDELVSDACLQTLTHNLVSPV